MAVFLLLMAMLVLAGCGYRPAATAGNRLGPDHRLWVSFISNDTVSPTAQTVLRRALLEEAHAMRGIAPAATSADADLLVSGSLRSYSSRIISYGDLEQDHDYDRAREYRLTIAVELELRSTGDQSLAWKGTLQAFQDYPANRDLALQHSAEEKALAAASRKIAQKLLLSLEQSY
jgi:outer membrane lipopolysaccharide assembly protein LptE/RlpB